ncbi:MAG: hypothetical protein AAF202_08415, partial [Pseudomonadota bacterium]
MSKITMIFLTLLAVFGAAPAIAEAWSPSDFKTYQLQSDGQLQISSEFKGSDQSVRNVIEDLDLRVSIKRFTVTRRDGGASVRWEPVCEESTTIEVEDLHGGGLISEKLMLACESELKGRGRVIVVVSGMVYESTWAGFSDEEPTRLRNFFSHLSLQSKDGTYIFGPGDFNLGYTRQLP